MICKLNNTFNKNTVSFQPHNITYSVKKTNVYLAPIQPTELELVELEDIEQEITPDQSVVKEYSNLKSSQRMERTNTPSTSGCIGKTMPQESN